MPMDDPHPNDDETFRDFLDRRELRLVESIAALRGELDPLERELAEIKKTRTALGLRTPFIIPSLRRSPETSPPDALKQTLERVVQEDISPNDMTIKELILRALLNLSQGATPAEIGEHIHRVHKREIDPGSIRPNLSRLREAGAVMHDGIASKWILEPKTLALLHTLYTETPLMKSATALAWRDDENARLPDGQVEPPYGQVEPPVRG
jgi:hypothetical protein